MFDELGQNHCNTQRQKLGSTQTLKTTKTTMIMSATTTSFSPIRKNYSIKYKFSHRRMLHLTLLGCLLLQLQVLHKAHAIPDYGDDGGSSEITSDNNNNSNDDVYEAALIQQEIEATKQRNEATNGSGEQALNDTDKNEQQTQLLASARVNVPTNHISTEESSALEEDTNTTREEINNMQEAGYDYSHDDDDDTTISGGSLEAMHGKINAELLTAQISATLPTTMIPEYLQRKAKAQPFNALTMTAASTEDVLATANNDANEDEDDVNASISDYMDDEDVGADDAREYQPSKETEAVPLAMKFYRTAEIEEDNNLAIVQDQQLQQLSPSVPMPQQQLLPEQHLDHQFHNNSEEEYYEDSRDQSLEQSNQLITITTTAPAMPYAAPSTAAVTATVTAADPTSAPALRRNDILLAGFGGLSLPWVSKDVPIPTVTIGLPEYGTQLAATTSTTTPTATILSAGSMETTVTTTTPTTVAPTTIATTSRSTGSSSSSGSNNNNKQGKQINVLRRKMLPHEQLRNYIEDAYIRMPLAVIVDPSSASLEKTKALWRDALRTNLNIKIVLVSLNASGVPAAYSFNNTRQFLAGLNSIKENDGGNAFIGIVHASELVPYDSAVFISTAAIPPHTELVQDAAITLLKKRIRLYLIWYGERSISENETQEGVGGILGEVAIRSGGEVLHIVGSEDSQELEGNTPTLIADAFRGSQEVDIPVDTTLSSLHVKIDSPMRMATLETPNGG